LGGNITPNRQAYGISITSALSDRYQIIGVNLTGNVTGPVNDGGAVNEKTIFGNAGYRTSNSGALEVPPGASSVVINHGLGATPAKTDFGLSTVVDIAGAGVGRFWVSAADANTFTVSVAPVATASVFLGWSVRIKGA
jgi:hypothetical protein